MAALQAQDIADMVQATLKNLGKGKMQQIAQNLTDYEVMSKLFKKERVQFNDGYAIQRTLLAKLAGSARHVGLFAQDTSNTTDVLTGFI
jgi:acyl-homoserine lactone acylase PvdQ